MNKILIDKIKEIKLSGDEFCKEINCDCGECPFNNGSDECDLYTLDQTILNYINYLN